jgi:hypothetical protein
MPDGRIISLVDIGSRQLVVPTGATIRVPEGCEWLITAMSVLPTRNYVPPDGSVRRDVADWGDVQIRIEDARAHCRTSALTLMDRYWGRYNLSPCLPEAVAKLELAMHAVQTAPRIVELARALEAGLEAVRGYLGAAMPQFTSPVMISGGRSFTIEHVDCEVHTDQLRAPGALDVELLLIVKRPVP